MITKSCERCEKEIQVRQADINRGWGRFCSKSCKAKKQTSKNPYSWGLPKRLFYSDGRHPLDIDQ